MMKKRIMHEVCVELVTKYKYVNVLYDDQQILVTVKDDKGTLLFDLSDNYPFTPPKITVNNIPYLKFMPSPTGRIDRLFKELHMCYKDKNKLCCLYCSSIITNTELWRPTHSIKTIISEIEWVREIKQRIKYMLIVEMLFIHFGNKMRRQINIDRQVLEYLFDYGDGF